MSYFTTDLYETKREIVNYSNNLSSGLSKPESKFVMDMMYGLSRGQSVLISDIARALEWAYEIDTSWTLPRDSSFHE